MYKRLVIILILEWDWIDDLIKYDKVYIEDNRVFNKNFLLSDELALYILD